MEIVAAGMGFCASWAGKAFAAFLRHGQRIHIRPEQERPAAFPSHLCGHSMPARMRIQAAAFQLLHGIGLSFWHMQAHLCVTVQPAAVGYSFLTQFQCPFIKIHNHTSFICHEN